VGCSGGCVSYPFTDHLGTALMVANACGQVPAGSKFRYSPFGEELTGSAANDNQPGYTGHVEDASGLTAPAGAFSAYGPSPGWTVPLSRTGAEVQARYYDPVIGRFLSNDPVNMIDPFGLCAADGGSGLCSDNAGIQAQIDEKLADPDSLASRVEAATLASGDSPGQRIEVLNIDGASEYVSQEGGNSYIVFGEEIAEVTDMNGNTYERKNSASEAFEHELSHALDDVTGNAPSGVGEVQSSGKIIDAKEARAINRANQYRSRKGVGYQRTGREYEDQ